MNYNTTVLIKEQVCNIAIVLSSIFDKLLLIHCFSVDLTINTLFANITNWWSFFFRKERTHFSHFNAVLIWQYTRLSDDWPVIVVSVMLMKAQDH